MQIDRGSGPGFVDEWIQFQLEETPLHLLPKLNLARDLIRTLLALDYLVSSFDFYPVSEAGIQLYGQRQKWMYGAVDFILEVENEMGLTLVPSFPKNYRSNPESFTGRLERANTIEKADLEKSGEVDPDEMVEKVRALENQVQANTKPNSFEALDEESALKIINSVRAAMDRYTVLGMSCDELLND